MHVEACDSLLNPGKASVVSCVLLTGLSVFQENCPQLILFTHADCSDGTVVELEGRPAVHHHAGVPAARAHTHPETAEAARQWPETIFTELLLWSWGTLTDLLAKPLCRLLEKTRLMMGSLTLYNRRVSSGLNTRDSLYSSVTESTQTTSSNTVKHTRPEEVQHNRKMFNSPFSIKLRLSGISSPVWDFPKRVGRSSISEGKTFILTFILVSVRIDQKPHLFLKPPPQPAQPVCWCYMTCGHQWEEQH